MHRQLEGIVVPIVTLYDGNGHIDHAGMRELVEFLLEHGVSGLFPCGTTGEGPLLTLDERRALAETVVSAVAGRVPVIVHTGAITTEEACALTEHAHGIGADAAAVFAPYYYSYTNEALFRHFAAVAEHVPELPLYLYNIPATTGNPLPIPLVRRLVEACPNIVGVKDSSGSLEYLVTLLRLRPLSFTVANGTDAHIFPAVAMGCLACVSGNANVVPELVVRLYRAARAGDVDTARDLQQRLNRVRQILKDGSDFSLLKGMLQMRGLAVGAEVRAPLSVASPEVIRDRWQRLQQVLQEGPEGR
ncbi:MAG: dihydrodipicolinate synthase family protein [Ardenticatenia bacterium]|nr:dihydrodipicolinate synthase family protein [Ardenticatenia bacterium]